MKGFFYLLFSVSLVLSVSAESWANQTTHRIKKGETLYEIAKDHGVSVKTLKQANHLSTSLIQPGDVLSIPARTSKTKSRKAQAKTSDTPSPSENRVLPDVKNTANTSQSLVTHVVKGGDNLYRISLRYGTTVKDLKHLNHLKSSRLQTGQALQVPAREEEMPDEVQEKTEDAMELAALEEGAEEGQQNPNSLDMENLREEEETTPSDSELMTYLSETAEGENIDENSISDFAKKYLGVPYRFGGESRRGIDCSAFVQRVYRYFSIDLPRTAREQFKAGVKISKNDLRVGDLLFFQTYAKFPSHVGIYMGGGKMIHASSRFKKVTITNVDLPYYQKRFIGIRRIPETENLFGSGRTVSLIP